MSENGATRFPDVRREATPAFSNFLNGSLYCLLLVYSAARFLQLSNRVPILIVLALHVLPPLAFALLHGTTLYRIRGVVVFVFLFLFAGNVLENVSILTGFPFGQYYFTDQMGPKIFAVPVFLGFAYIGMAYLSWILANLILRTEHSSLFGLKLVLVTALASLIVVAWDLSQDAVWSTILHLWIWPRGGVYFGVPLSNFFGWYFTVFMIYQLFAIYLRRNVVSVVSFPRSSSSVAILFYAVSAAGNILLVLRRTSVSVVTDAAGVQWRIRDITFAGALISIFVMGSFAAFAWMRTGAVDRHKRNNQLNNQNISNYARI